MNRSEPMIFPALVVGSGPCGAACFAKLREMGVDAWLIDAGREPSADTTALATKLARTPASEWPTIKVQRAPNGQNLKTWLGDDFATDERGGAYAVSTALKNSQAFGGLSWVWGCSVARWDDLAALPKGMTAAYDWLDRHVPVTDSGRLSPTAQRWLGRASALAGSRFAVEAPRLTIDSDRCLRCGLCMGGCPIHATWISSDWVRRVAPSARTLLGYRVESVAEIGNCIEVRCRTGQGTAQRWFAKEVFIAAGAAGSAAIALGSNPGMEQVRLTDPRYVMGLAYVYPGIAPLPGEEDDHALAKLKLTDREAGIYWQAYSRMPQTDAYLTLGLPRQLGLRVSQRLGVLQGFLAPGPESAIVVKRSDGGYVAEGRLDPHDEARAGLGLQGLRSRRRQLGAYPLPGARLGHPGEGQHAGCGLPMGKLTDKLGRLPGQRRIHYVDPIVLPKLPAAPHTWTAMANAARIAEASRG